MSSTSLGGIADPVATTKSEKTKAATNEGDRSLAFSSLRQAMRDNVVEAHKVSPVFKPLSEYTPGREKMHVL